MLKVSDFGQSEQPNEQGHPLGRPRENGAASMDQSISINRGISIDTVASTDFADALPSSETYLGEESSDLNSAVDCHINRVAVASTVTADAIAPSELLKLSSTSWQDKAFSFARVCAYIVICFATSYAPVDGLVRYGYFHMPNKAWFWFTVSSFELTLSLLMLYLCSRFIEKKPFLSYGFTGCTMSGGYKEVIAGISCAGLMVSTVMLVLYLTGCYQVASVAWNAHFLVYLPFLVVAAMREEVMFRGYVLQTLEKSWGSVWAIVISSLLFGFLHIINFEPGVQLGSKIYSCLCLSIDAGVVFAVAYLFKRRLWFPFGMHFAWNVFEGPVYGTLVSSLNLGKPLVEAKLIGPDFLTGGVFGPEASLVEVFVCCLLVGILWPAARLKLVRNKD